MHFVILSQYYPPEIGAPQARLSELASRFVARGHRVTVLTAKPNYPSGRIAPGYAGVWRRETREGAAVLRTFIYPTQSTRLVPRMTNYLSFMFSSATFGTLLLPRADYLLVESPPLFLGLAGLWLSRIKGARLIFNVSDLWPDSVVRLGKLTAGSRVHRAMTGLEEFCYSRAWAVTGQSAGILADVRARLPEKRVYHLSNGVDAARFACAAPDAALRADLGEGRSCLAIYAGLHGLAQGLEQWLEVAARLRDERELMFVFIGDGPEREALVARAQALGLDNVRFHRALPRERMPAVAASADIALVSLKLDLPGAVPSKIYEAMGAGVPVLLLASGEPAEIVRHTGAGLTVAIGDISRAAAAVRRLAHDVDLRRELGAAGRRAAADEFDRDRIAASFIEYLEKEKLC
ncbi:MAG: hypothetical protein RIR76_517 [Verrucomicrobiota bacterium]